MTSCLPLVHQPAFQKEVCSKRTEFAHAGSKFFPLRVDNSSEWRLNNFHRFVSLGSIPIPLKEAPRQIPKTLQYEFIYIIFWHWYGRR